MHVGDVLVAGQRVADQHGVGALGVERAVGLVGDLERRQLDAGVEPQRPVGAEPRDQRIARRVGLAGASRCIRSLYRRRPYHRSEASCPGGRKWLACQFEVR